MELFKRTMKEAENGQKELIQRLNEQAEIPKFSLKMQTNDDLYFQYGIQAAVDSTENIENRRLRR